MHLGWRYCLSPVLRALSPVHLGWRCCCSPPRRALCVCSLDLSLVSPSRDVAMASAPPSPPLPDQRGFVECHLCAMLLSGRAVWEQHVRGTKHRRLKAATDAPASSADRTTRWMCPLCAAHNDAAASLFMHVNGSRHRRAIGRLREAGRLEETAPLVPRLREALAEVRRTGDDDAQFAALLQAAEEDAGIDGGRVQHRDDDHRNGGNGIDDNNNYGNNVYNAGGLQRSHPDAASCGGPAAAPAPAAGPSAGVAGCGTRVAGGAAHVGKRAYDGGDAGGASQRRRLSDGDVRTRSLSGGVRYGCGSRSVRRDVGDAGGASDVRGSRGSSSSGVLTTFIVPPGARPWLECPRCLSLYSSADAFADHPCNPPSLQGKGPPRPGDRREPAR